jgi:hypothetical protein
MGWHLENEVAKLLKPRQSFWITLYILPPFVYLLWFNTAYQYTTPINLRFFILGLKYSGWLIWFFKVHYILRGISFSVFPLFHLCPVFRNTTRA